MAGDGVAFRAGEAERRISLTVRDVRLLDGPGFVARHGSFRELFALDFVRGLRAPPEGRVLLTHPRGMLVTELTRLLAALEEERELISYSYSFRFSGKPEHGGGGRVSGFTVRGLHGSVSVRPSGYCDVVLRGPRSEVAEVIDLRVAGPLETDTWGVLTVRRRRAQVGWFTQLPPLIDWLSGVPSAEIGVVHV